MAKKGEQSLEIQNFVLWIPVLPGVSHLCSAFVCGSLSESKNRLFWVHWRLYASLDCGRRRFRHEIRLRPRIYLRRENEPWPNIGERRGAILCKRWIRNGPVLRTWG